jgi:hypothetical protein
VRWTVSRELITNVLLVDGFSSVFVYPKALAENKRTL